MKIALGSFASLREFPPHLIPQRYRWNSTDLGALRAHVNVTLKVREAGAGDLEHSRSHSAGADAA